MKFRKKFRLVLKKAKQISYFKYKIDTFNIQQYWYILNRFFNNSKNRFIK